MAFDKFLFENLFFELSALFGLRLNSDVIDYIQDQISIKLDQIPNDFITGNDVDVLPSHKTVIKAGIGLLYRHLSNAEYLEKIK